MKKRILTIAVLTALSIGASARAVFVTGQITFSGYAVPVGATSMGSATGLDFVSGPNGVSSSAPGGVVVYGAGTGSFAALGSAASISGGAGSVADLSNFATAAPINTFVAFASTPTVTLDLTSFTSIAHNVPADSLTLTALGTLHFAGFNDTPVKFSLTSVGEGTVSYSSTISTVVPEPTTLVGLGGGLLLWAARRRIHSPSCRSI